MFKRLKHRVQKWAINFIVPFAILDSIWVILPAIRQLYLTNGDKKGLEKTDNLIRSLRKLLPKEITDQK